MSVDNATSAVSESIPSRSFSLSSIDWFGFDLDHTLIRYKLPKFNPFIYRIMADYLVTHQHFNPILSTIEYNSSFAIKGLIYDSFYGDLLQLNSAGRVIHSRHGTNNTTINQSILDNRYPAGLAGIEEDTSKRYLCMFSYFELAVAFLIANLVDLIDQNQLFNPAEIHLVPTYTIQQYNNSTTSTTSTKYSSFLSALYAGFEWQYGNYNQGEYFHTLRSNISEYIYRRTDVVEWLKLLLAAGKKLFIITNSRYDYTELLAEYALGADWKSLFHLIIADSKKPLFFNNNGNNNSSNSNSSNSSNRPIRPYYRINPIDLTADYDSGECNLQDLINGGSYLYGNSDLLHQAMTAITNNSSTNNTANNQREPIVLYFGDHLKTDIVALKQHTNWLAAAIIEELENEHPPIQSHTNNKIIQYTKNNNISNSTDTAAVITTTNSTTESADYISVSKSTYFCPFFTSNYQNQESTTTNNTELPANNIGCDADCSVDILLPSVTVDTNNGSYWHAYITENAEISLPCLSILTKLPINNDSNTDNTTDNIIHQFHYECGMKHLYLIPHSNTNSK